MAIIAVPNKSEAHHDLLPIADLGDLETKIAFKSTDRRLGLHSRQPPSVQSSIAMHADEWESSRLAPWYRAVSTSVTRGASYLRGKAVAVRE
ncbi:hypothetical protein LIA77_07793 [Sarocladium implicatum]|jgi:hypothetical protein|nr:hypothetical protein LIA77_07793 [Sarocladium implicatum]